MHCSLDLGWVDHSDLGKSTNCGHLVHLHSSSGILGRFAGTHSPTCLDGWHSHIGSSILVVLLAATVIALLSMLTGIVYEVALIVALVGIEVFLAAHRVHFTPGILPWSVGVVNFLVYGIGLVETLILHNLATLILVHIIAILVILLGIASCLLHLICSNLDQITILVVVNLLILLLVSWVGRVLDVISILIIVSLTIANILVIFRS